MCSVGILPPREAFAKTSVGDLSIRLAAAADVPTICRLVNAAYRGADGARGWTSEVDWVDGPRIRYDQVAGLLGAVDSWLLVGTLRGHVTACVHLQCTGTDAHLGMLAVAPNQQAVGLGSSLMRHAERCAQQVLAAQRMVISVLSQRSELIAFYERRGYRRTGAVAAYPVHLNVGVPKCSDLTVACLTKSLPGDSDP